MYRLEEQDLIYVAESATSFFNWTLPAVVAGWLTKRLYLMERPWTPRSLSVSLSFLPVLLPALSATVLYHLYFRADPRLPALLAKYPRDMDFKARPQHSMLRRGRKPDTTHKPE